MEPLIFTDNQMTKCLGRKTGLWQEEGAGLVWRETLKELLSDSLELLGGRTHRWVTEKSFQLSNQIFAICPLSDPTPSSWVVVTIHKMCSFAHHQYVIPIAQWAFCNARGNTSPTNQLHSPVRVVPDPFLLKVRGTTEVVWHCRGELQILNGTCQGRSSP